MAPAPGRILREQQFPGGMVTFEDFKASLALDTPPAGLTGLQLGLWHDARGDWHAAHAAAQALSDASGAWLHAYLHRKEGDLSNARYWYGRAGREMPGCSLDEEWRTLATAFTGA